MVIRYVAYTWQGERVEGTLDVEKEEEARELLHRDDLIPYRLSRVRQRPSFARLAPFLFKPKPQELIEFTRGISSLLRSGIPLRETLVILRTENSSLGLKEVIRQVIEDIEGGSRFSDAMERHRSIFSGFYIRVLRFGESTGALAPAIQQMAESLEKSKSMKDKVKAALIYPMLSLIVAIVVAFILVTFSLPALVGLLEDFGGELPTITKLLLSISDFITAYRYFLFAGTGGLATAAWLYARTAQGARVRDRILIKIPVVGSVLMQSNLFNFTTFVQESFNVIGHFSC